jgi:hypothetical protein
MIFTFDFFFKKNIVISKKKTSFYEWFLRLIFFEINDIFYKFLRFYLFILYTP